MCPTTLPFQLVGLNSVLIPVSKHLTQSGVQLSPRYKVFMNTAKKLKLTGCIGPNNYQNKTVPKKLGKWVLVKTQIRCVCRGDHGTFNSCPIMSPLKSGPCCFVISNLGLNSAQSLSSVKLQVIKTLCSSMGWLATCGVWFSPPLCILGLTLWASEHYLSKPSHQAAFRF